MRKPFYTWTGLFTRLGFTIREKRPTALKHRRLQVEPLPPRVMLTATVGALSPASRPGNADLWQSPLTAVAAPLTTGPVVGQLAEQPTGNAQAAVPSDAHGKADVSSSLALRAGNKTAKTETDKTGTLSRETNGIVPGLSGNDAVPKGNGKAATAQDDSARRGAADPAETADRQISRDPSGTARGAKALGNLQGQTHVQGWAIGRPDEDPRSSQAWQSPGHANRLDQPDEQGDVGLQSMGLMYGGTGSGSSSGSGAETRRFLGYTSFAGEEPYTLSTSYIVNPTSPFDLANKGNYGSTTSVNRTAYNYWTQNGIDYTESKTEVGSLVILATLAGDDWTYDESLSVTYTATITGSDNSSASESGDYEYEFSAGGDDTNSLYTFHALVSGSGSGTFTESWDEDGVSGEITYQWSASGGHEDWVSNDTDSSASTSVGSASGSGHADGSFTGAGSYEYDWALGAVGTISQNGEDHESYDYSATYTSGSGGWSATGSASAYESGRGRILLRHSRRQLLGRRQRRFQRQRGQLSLRLGLFRHPQRGRQRHVPLLGQHLVGPACRRRELAA